MRTLIAVLALVACPTVWAEHLDYFSGRKWVEEQCATNATPAHERLFVGRIASPRYASIARFHQGMNLRELIDQSPLKGKIVRVCVMRPDRLKTGPFTRRTYIKVGRSERPDYEVKSRDVIWLYDDDGPIIQR